MKNVAQQIAEAPIEVREPKTPLSASGGWPDPDLTILVAGRREPPELPLEVFGDFWAGWIAGHAENRSVPADYGAAGRLASSGALIGNARWVSPWQGWSEPPVLWIGAVGNPSSGKSPGLDAPLNLMRQIEAEMAEGFSETLRSWETQKETAKAIRDQWQSEIKEAIKKKVAAPDMPADAVVQDAPVRPRVHISDATPEKLGRLLAAHPRGLLFHRDELSGWLGNFDRYGGAGGDRAFWAEAFGGRPYAIDRVKHDEPILIPNLTVAVVGGIQPDKLRTMLMAGDDDGLPARFLFSWPKAIPPKRPRNDVDDRPALAALARLHALRMTEDDQGRPCPLSVRLSGEAADLFQEWRLANHHDDIDAFGMYASHIGKLPGLTLRLALVLEFLKWSEVGGPEPETIGTEATAYAAHLIDEYFKPMALRVYGDAALPEAEHHAAGIARRIIKNKPTVVNAREIRRVWRLPGLSTSTKITDALEVLVEAEILRSAPSRLGETPGRNKSDFEVNPRLWRAVQ